LKLKYDEALSNSAFNVNLRRYIKGCPPEGNILGGSISFEPEFISAVETITIEGVHHCDDPVGRCRLTLSNPH